MKTELDNSQSVQDLFSPRPAMEQCPNECPKQDLTLACDSRVPRHILCSGSTISAEGNSGLDGNNFEAGTRYSL